MKLKFLGDDTVTMYGFDFPPNKVVEVPDDAVAYTEWTLVNGERTPRHVKVIDKLKNHKMFEVSDGKQTKKTPNEETVEAPEETRVLSERDQLRAECDELGIIYSPLAGVKALQKKIDGAH